MDSVSAIAGGTSAVLLIGISLLPFIILCVIAYRLRIIMINTFKSSKTAGVNFYVQAKSYEKIGDQKEARRHYCLAYWALSEVGIAKFKWYRETVSIQDLQVHLNS